LVKPDQHTLIYIRIYLLCADPVQSDGADKG
jgi:hypothetical protein